MNYYEARQRSDKSGWAWTSMNDGVVHATGGCVTWPDGPPVTIEDSIGPNAKPIGPDHQHETREEAERCFYDYELAHLRETTGASDTQRRCEHESPAFGALPHRCDNWTQKALEARHLGSADLCDDHRTPAGWAAVHPFAPGISITSSY